MTVGTQQLLASVVSKPKLSSVDARFMGVIWDCFTTWLAEQLHAKLPVRCLGLGEFTLRRDTIGPMEFFNPMFVLSEGFAHRFQLHDRRPKPAALGSASAARATDVDIAKVTQMVTEKLGEVVLRETVEHALRDAIERIGDFCSDERAHGIVTIDLLLGKLVCENRSVELHFLSQDERARALDAKKKANAKASARTVNWGGAGGAGDELGIIGAGARPGTALSDAGTRASSLAGRPASSGQGAALPDPPLQRPRRTQVKKVAALDPRDMLLSHATQIARKAEAVRDEHKSEAEQFSSDMSRLRGEMVLELEERVHRKSHMRDVALIHQVQAHEKALRDRDARQLLGTDHFPFRTEEQAKAQVKESNAVLKQNLDGQMAELSMARRILAKGAYSASGTPDVFATSLSMGHSEQPPPSASSDRPQLAMQVAIDDAYVRYSRFLEGRAGAEERARSYADEQSLLAEQAEASVSLSSRSARTSRRSTWQRCPRPSHATCTSWRSRGSSCVTRSTSRWRRSRGRGRSRRARRWRRRPRCCSSSAPSCARHVRATCSARRRSRWYCARRGAGRPRSRISRKSSRPPTS
ncbi:hypothetical protein T492DRAFT_1020020, partial [Pavlovales sp. CCMP2436]